MSALPGAAVVHSRDSGLHREGEGGGDDDKCSEEERLRSHERFGMRDDWVCYVLCCVVWIERQGWVEYLWREGVRRVEEMLRGLISEF